MKKGLASRETSPQFGVYMLQLKEHVVIRGNKYTNAILRAVQIVYAHHSTDKLEVITSGNDSKHGTKSYHYKDRALDIRFWNIPADKREQVATEIRAELPVYYDVVVEADHYHIEADEVKEQKHGS